MAALPSGLTLPPGWGFGPWAPPPATHHRYWTQERVSEIVRALRESGYGQAPVRPRRKIADIRARFGCSERTAWRALRALREPR